MVVKPEQERVRNLLTDTVTLLCKNGLTYNKEMKVQGLLGITLDEDEVFVVHINEKFADLLAGKDLADGTIDFPEALGVDKDSEGSSSGKRRRKRRGSRDSDIGSPSSNSTPSKRHRDSTSQDSQDIRVKQEKTDVVCLDDDPPLSIKPDPSINYGQQQHGSSQPYGTGLVQNRNTVGQISDNSNNSWDGAQLPQITSYQGGGGAPGGAAWNQGSNQSSADTLAAWHLVSGLGQKRRPRQSNDKTHRCVVQGCDKAFYRSYELTRHCKLKHQGFNPAFSVVNSPDDELNPSARQQPITDGTPCSEEQGLYSVYGGEEGE